MLHVRDLDDGSGLICCSLIRTWWVPGRGKCAESLSMQWVTADALRATVDDIIKACRHAAREVSAEDMLPFE